ncbi:MAG TPA: YetF domain-containing protein [Chloroflexia bacterium]|nr:YetF domain-containing protein [Chloroflexia bacterium]
MDKIFGLDWGKTFLPDTPLLETFLRGTVTYLALFLMLRLVLKRQAGTVGITDLLVIVLIADAAQNAMAGSYNSITDGLLLVGTIIFWAWALDWLGYRFPFIQKIIHPDPLPLIRNGQINKRNMKRELITEEELMSQLRQQGVSDPSEVKEAFMEGDGRFSVVNYDKKEDKPKGSPERQV